MISRYDQGMNTPNETPGHPLTETAAAELSKKFMPGVAFQILASVSPEDLTEYARLAYDLAREHEREHADPHRDPRLWQDCTREDIRKDDLVEARIDDSLRIGVAHCQDGVGDWWTEGGYPLTHRDRWPLRRIPTPATRRDEASKERMMDEKKIEPTDAMVDEAANALCLNATGTSLSFQDYADKHTYRHRARVALRVVLNHPDAPGLFAAEWKANAEAAAERAERAEDRLADSVHVDEAARRVEAAREQALDEGWNEGWNGAANALGRIGFRHLTPTIRDANPYRPAPALPTEDGAVIVPAEGHEFIEATICGETHYARAALRSWVGDWYAAWRAGERKCGLAASGDITPGTWRVADQ